MDMKENNKEQTLGNKEQTLGQPWLKAVDLITSTLQDAAPFRQPAVEKKYHEHFLQSIICIDNVGSTMTLGISTAYHLGVLIVRHHEKGISNFDDYMFILRLSVLIGLWVVLSMSSRMSEKQRIRVAVFVRRAIHIRFLFFLAELIFMDMHIERAKISSLILTFAFSVTLDSYKEQMILIGVLAYAGHFSRIVIHKNPQSWATELEGLTFSTILYVFCIFLFTVFQVKSRTRFLRQYAQFISQCS
ncbi:hypothetical protein GUITHDRAFT_102977 [Guillardia theta CCMP2712]|uniref:Uncharacterized protein n=1 Tax=Guillardia theta (strain CCMP2712) TaxID=905079 RepID=L1JSJ3_GUITC|nr:hypothetical protein GUITHDRAFT_102977 [Guillardia theta CCMP2712]EKX51053.1 hypothetical protein GUITHDRAFT_102977 [Guillardia theta CCMP2712]|eukprot:XP_005838033.1 hypothetical protein GUITHDRAFT_102977 [Guillardia theta CCMP2712]